MPDFGIIAMGLLGGLALFLYGMDLMSGALRIIAGSGLRKLLTDLTKNRLMAVITGAVTTAIVQSSSVTTVLVVGFISAGLMSLTQSIGVIMGANIGSTITAQLVAFNITQYALLMVAAGFGVLSFGKKERVKQLGKAIMGMGLLFFGMGVMSTSTAPLREYQPFIDAMQQMHNPLLGILAGLIFTALVQSSAATTGIVIVLAAEGFITLEAGITLAFGANIGTCVTAILSAIGKPAEARRAAAIHVIFNVLGVLIWLPLISQLATWVTELSPGNVPRQIANANTLFNVANTVIFIWFNRLFARLATRLVREKPTPLPKAAQPLFLDPVYLETPALAVDRVRLETRHLGELTLDVVAAMNDSGNPNLERIEERAADVEILTREILDYARRLTAGNLTQKEGHQLQKTLNIVNHLGDISETVTLNLGTLIREWRNRRVEPSNQTRKQIADIYSSLQEAIRLAVEASTTEADRGKALEVIAMKSRFNGQVDELARHLGQRLLSSDPHRAEIYQLESRLLEVMRRLYYFAKCIAKTVAEEPPDEPAPDNRDPN